jgi:hypothetical protein
MVNALRDGIMARLNALLDAARILVQQIRDLLPFSDAKKGPLSDLTAAGAAIPKTLADGIRSNQAMAVRAAARMAAAVQSSIQIGAAYTSPPFALATAGSTERHARPVPVNVYQTITVNGSANPSDVRSAARLGIIDAARSMGLAYNG